VLEEPGIGTWVAYAFIVAFLLFLLVMFLRVAMLASVLWFHPVARILKHIPGLRRLVPMDARASGTGKSADADEVHDRDRR